MLCTLIFFRKQYQVSSNLSLVVIPCIAKNPSNLDLGPIVGFLLSSRSFSERGGNHRAFRSLKSEIKGTSLKSFQWSFFFNWVSREILQYLGKDLIILISISKKEHKNSIPTFRR